MAGSGNASPPLMAVVNAAVPTPAVCRKFSTRVLSWFDQHGRKHLPWQQETNAYQVWVSEIMLQQTQVATVIPYYEKFIARFATVEALAAAQQDEVLQHWSGLGYYARGRNLHKAAQIVVNDLDGRFPSSVDELIALPGIGRSTAGAIRSLAFGEYAAILDGNVKRVLCRHYAIDGWYGQTSVERFLWQVTEAVTPKQRTGPFNQAMMDLGATLCTRSAPQCQRCPLQKSCKAHALGTPTAWPHKKPKADKPVRATHMLLLEDSKGRVQLERRPASGIWGGLWCFPQFDDVQSLLSHAESAGTVDPAQVSHWGLFRHTFSHYHLDITPVHVRLRARSRSAVRETDSVVWAAPDEQPGGLPAPVSKLLDTLRRSLV